VAPVCACLAWAFGQFALLQQIGGPHPLRSLATNITARGIDPARAEILDAHLLSYLTGQQCHVGEFEPFWARLAHYEPLIDENGPADYIVNTREIDRTDEWVCGGWPGEPPPETKRFLWPRLMCALAREPGLLLSRTPLVDGYEHVRLRRPLSARTFQSAIPNM
jgi:hypothetical protein